MKPKYFIMKFIKKLLVVLISLTVVVVLGAWLYSFSFHPTYEGELELSKLNSEVSVHFDDYGVPHINAQNQEDAYRALGYVHAQDRLWQMELIRRVAAGRLSEVFGENKAVQEADIFFSGLGIEEDAEKSIEQLDKNSDSYILATAYLDGINQFIEEGFTPVEYKLTGLKKETFTLKDMYNVLGYMAFSFASAHKTDPLLTEVKEKLGTAYLQELNISAENTTLIRNEKNPMLKATLAKAVNNLYEALPVSSFIGSNSWVIGSEKTQSGKVIFANDPHISYGQPSVWYEAHIKTPEYEMYGYHLALTPFPLLGHNRGYAYGLTMFENDDVDFFFEENHPTNPDQYKIPTGYEDYKIINKTLKVKDKPDSTYQIKVSRHGPIMNDLITHIKDERPIAMWWVYTQFPNKILDVTYKLSHSQSLVDFKEGVKLLHAPGLNIMYGDNDNNIAWFAAGKLYKYKEGVNSKLILDGASGENEIVEMIDFEENPQAINPSWNYVYSANNQPDTIAGFLYPGYYLPEDRAERIVDFLEAKNDFTKEDVMEMIFDVKSNITPKVVQELANVIASENLSQKEQEVLNNLQEWNGDYYKESTAPTIYNRFLYEFLSATYKDEMGEAYSQFLNTHLQKRMILPQISRENSIWWDDIATEKKETRKDVLKKAFQKTVSFLEKQLGEEISSWTWNRVTSLEHKHAIGEVKLLRKYFNVGPFQIDGGNEVINNQLFKLDSTGYYKVTAGPSTRRVIDFSDVENSMSILPTGQSGNVFSPHYKDQAEKFINGKFIKMVMNPNEIQKIKNKLIFKAKRN